MIKASVRYPKGYEGHGRVYLGRERLGSVNRISDGRWLASYGTTAWDKRKVPGAFSTAEEAAEALVGPLRERYELNRVRDREAKVERPCAACGAASGTTNTDLLQLPDLGWVRLCRDLRDCQRRCAVEQQRGAGE